MTRKIVLFIVILVLFLTACGQASSPVQTPVFTPTPPPLPESGKATIIGRVINQQGEAVPHTTVQLAEVVRGVEGRGGAFILESRSSPGTNTDEAGYFIFSNIKGTEYVIVLGDVDGIGVYEIIAESDGKPRIFNMPADQVTDVGEIIASKQLPQLIPGLELTPVILPTSIPYPESYGLPYPIPSTP